MKKILMILLSVYSLNAVAQEEVQVSYYNENGEEVRKKQAHYIRIVTTRGENFEFKETWMNGDLKRTGFATQYEPRLRQSGKEITYYRNGKIKQEHEVKGSNSIGEIKR
jgi:antitoxin component YwqK of YwqJK toxin-antitoxin module